jgi:LysM repeat protein
MRPGLFSVIVFLFAVGTILPLYSQTEPVEVVRSDDKVVIGNKVYYIHLVKSGQTLYSISRVYNVPQKDILLENPNIYIGLQADQALKIPYVPEEERTAVPDDPDGDYVYHTIEQGQTLFFLSRTYDVEIDEIIRLNPGAEDGLQINQVVKIPARTVYISRDGFPSEDEQFIYHKVERGETLYSLSRKYDIPVRVIRQANDKLVWGIKYGEYIRIPKEIDVEEDVVPPPGKHREEIAEDIAKPGFYEYEIRTDAECLQFDYRTYNGPFNVALMLPLFLDRNYPVELPDTVDLETARALIDSLYPQYVKSIDQLHHETIPFLEFYEGAKLAVDSLVRAGLTVKLNVYDTERDPDKVRGIINNPDFRENDLIIGPVYPENFDIVSQWALQNSVNIVSPLTTRNEFLTGNPFVFQVNPSTSVEIEQASAFISNFPSSNFVLIHKNDFYERDIVESFRTNIFKQFNYSSDYKNLVFKEVVFDEASVNIEQSLVTEGNNIVIIASSNQAFVSNMLMRLNILSRSYEITIFGLNDWQRFPNIEVEYLHNMELHFASPFFIDYDNEKVKGFISRYRNTYYTEPTHYVFRGYDIMFYFLQAMKNYGTDFRDCLPALRTDLLQADFLFRQSDHRNGLENNGISIVRYNKDLYIERLGLNGYHY